MVNLERRARRLTSDVREEQVERPRHARQIQGADEHALRSGSCGR